MKITANNESETKMNAWITENLILKKQSKHFVIMYKTTKCPASGSPAKKLLTVSIIKTRILVITLNLYQTNI
jgi:hypothetical protein